MAQTDGMHADTHRGGFVLLSIKDACSDEMLPAWTAYLVIWCLPLRLTLYLAHKYGTLQWTCLFHFKDPRER